MEDTGYSLEKKKTHSSPAYQTGRKNRNKRKLLRRDTSQKKKRGKEIYRERGGEG